MGWTAVIPCVRRAAPRRFLAAACAAVLFAAGALGSAAAAQTPAQGTVNDFARLAAQLASSQSAAPAASGSEAVQEQALAILDRAVLQSLNAEPASGGAQSGPYLGALNQELSAFATHLGESFRVVIANSGDAKCEVGGVLPDTLYALIANFGTAGPSAVRLYAGPPGKRSLLARIDRYAQKDFFDDYVDLVPLSGTSAVGCNAAPGLFLTVAGRTDDLQTGVFTVWRPEPGKVSVIWMSDILEQSNYALTPAGLKLAYCGESDPVTGACRKPTVDTYSWQRGQWTRVATQNCAPTGPCG